MRQRLSLPFLIAILSTPLSVRPANAEGLVTFFERCHALIDRVGRHEVETQNLHERNQLYRLRQLRQEMLQSESEFSLQQRQARKDEYESLFAEHLNDVAHRFNEFHRNTGLSLVQASDNTLQVHYNASEAREEPPTLVGRLLKRKLRQSKFTRVSYWYSPGKKFTNQARGLFQKDATATRIYLNLLDLHSFDSYPDVFVHEVEHLKTDEGQHRSAHHRMRKILITASKETSENFASPYLKVYGRFSVDEIIAFRRAAYANIINLRLLLSKHTGLYEGETGRLEHESRQRQIMDHFAVLTENLWNLRQLREDLLKVVSGSLAQLGKTKIPLVETKSGALHAVLSYEGHSKSRDLLQAGFSLPIELSSLDRWTAKQGQRWFRFGQTERLVPRTALPKIRRSLETLLDYTISRSEDLVQLEHDLWPTFIAFDDNNIGMHEAIEEIRRVLEDFKK
ncbi:MAG TPA: hypothetical protein VM901_11335 [Bdellovibrionota bacterium]|jgi:hypothetical protein|nr:hypothetical protein [Bdellovibrionota bacterium]